MVRVRPQKLFYTFAFFIWFLVLLSLLYKAFFTDLAKTHYKRLKQELSSHLKVDQDQAFYRNIKLLPHKNFEEINDDSNVSEHAIKQNEYEIKTSKNQSIKLWFMKDGNLRPEFFKPYVPLHLWPEQIGHDRIIDQLLYLPEQYQNELSVNSQLATQNTYYSSKKKLKKIMLVGSFESMNLNAGRSIFLKNKCPVNTCTLARSFFGTANPDAVVFKEKYMSGIYSFIRRRPEQVWILFLLESPLNMGELGKFPNIFNWTASYRRDSEIVTPYAKYVPYNVARLYAPMKVKTPEFRNYAANKTKKVAWFVSNCDTRNHRLQYAEKLSHYIQVDIYGSCGTMSCPRANHSKCLEMLDRDYKFYLSFENSNCKDYITEKFFENGLSRDVLPVVMGPKREDYERVAPPYSFIHVNDFASPKDLADYLHVLDTNDGLYNEYFKWKCRGEFINTRFWCRLCALLHAPREHKSYEDIHEWWSGPGICQA